MFHETRVWQEPREFDDPLELAKQLTGHTWTLCSSFRFGKLLLLNDSTGEDGAQEYAVVFGQEPGRLVQVESITTSWGIAPELLAATLVRLDDDPAAYWGDMWGPRFEQATVRPKVEAHDVCKACA